MSYQYPVLDNRPIDQWKVTELKEELKRRRLPLKGLKDDLIKRLDEALRIERDNAVLVESENAKEVESGLNLDLQPAVGLKISDQLPLLADDNEMTNAKRLDSGIKESVETIVNDDNEITDDRKLHSGMNDIVETTGDRKLQGRVSTVNLSSSTLDGELIVNSATVETSVTLADAICSEVASTEKEVQVSGTQGVNGDSDIQPDSEDPKARLENESLNSPNKDTMLETTVKNQVSEVSTNIGFEIKSDSVSTVSFPIHEKTELKDNMIIDDVKLEPNVVKTEMVEPSFSNVVPVDGESHPMDVEDPLEKKVSVEERQEIGGKNVDESEKLDIVDMGDSEKLNLDRSSGEDSIEDDVLESKPIDSNFTSDAAGDRSEKSEVVVMKDESAVEIVCIDVSTDQKETFAEEKVIPAVPPEKRKHNDEAAIGNTEPMKRQRKWNSESLKLPETQSSNPLVSTTPKDMFQPVRRNFSRSDSSVSDDAPKERVVPPSEKPATNSLRIDRFLRPFTLKAVQELLGKTGTVTSFWMDNIKTHCYVTYSSVEEAVETRNAVYNLQWPPNGGRLLVAEFVEPQEVKMRVDGPPPSPVAPITPTVAAPTPPAQPSPRQPATRQHLPPRPTLPPPPPLSDPPPARERLGRQAPPLLPETLDPPIVTLDDLFRKTKATPRIYYLPLSGEQVAAKVAERGKNNKP